MGLDPLSPVAPARIRALLVPVGHLRQSRFTGFANRLERNRIVRLGDVSPDSRPHRTLFSPLAFPEGLIVYDLSPAVPLSSDLGLTPFEFYRQPLLIVGILDGRETNVGSASGLNGAEEEDSLPTAQNPESLRHILDDLRADFSGSILYHLLVFDLENGQDTLPEGVSAIPPPERSRSTTVKTVMCDITSRLLGEMTSWGKNIQNAPILETPKVSDLPNSNERMLSALPAYLTSSSKIDLPVPGRSRSFSPAIDESKSNHRMSLPVHISSSKNSRSATPDSRAPSPHRRPGTPPSTSEDLSNPPNFASPPKPRAVSQERSRPNSQDMGSRKHRAESLGDRERTKTKGRIGVVIGSMFLLAGQWPDAVKELVQSAKITRSNSDYVWQAKALDYLLVCLLMYAWAGMNFRIPDILRPGLERPGSNSSKTNSHRASLSPTELAAPQTGDPAALQMTLESLVELLPGVANNILNLYSRAWTFTDDKIPPLSYSHSTIRLVKLLIGVRRKQSQLDQNVLDHVVLGEPLHDTPTNVVKPFMSASELSSLLLRAYPVTADNSMPLPERIYIQASIASVLSDLGYHRKKAVVMKEILMALLPALVQARKDCAAEMGVHPAASLASLNLTNGNGLLEEGSAAHVEDSDLAMRNFLKLICESFGLETVNEREISNKNSDMQDINIATQNTADSQIRAIYYASMQHIGSLDLKIDIIRACISICEALPNLSGALHYSAELLRTAGSGIAPGPENSNGLPALPIEEQLRLVNNISRTLGAAQHLGLQHPEADYWDEFLVRGIEFVDGSPSKALVPHAKSELEIVETIAAKKEKNPFIYNPFLKTNRAGAVAEPVLIAGEEVILQVTLQNLYDFDLYVEHIQLKADDANFKSYPQYLMIGPYRTQTVLLIGVAQTIGTLNILGCVAKIRGCRERSFANFKDPWEFKVDGKGGNLQPDVLAIEKLIGNSSKSTSSKSFAGPKASPLSLRVIDSQPSLQLTQSSLSQSAVMLLEGETRTLFITIRNNSQSTEADLVLLSFNDSTASRVQSMLASKELSEVELYELELSSSRKQPFRWIRNDGHQDDFKINPGDEKKLEIAVSGKPGLSHGSIQVDYGYLGRPRADVTDKFYTRQLKIPLNITVNASIDLVRCDIAPFSPDLGHSEPLDLSVDNRESLNDLTTASHITRLVHQSDPQKPFFLLLFDFRNSWPTTLILSLTLADETTHHPIPPGSTIRIPLPHPKIYLSPTDAHAPIPNFNPATARQYVVSSTTKRTPEAEVTFREAFWYREELLKQLSATWSEESKSRRGEVEMRALRLTGRMVSLLKLGDLEIHMSIVNEASSDGGEPCAIRQKGKQTFAVTTTTFLKLRTTLCNRSDAPIRPLLRLQPTLAGQPHNVALDLGKKLLVNGVLQRGLPTLEPGEERSVDTGFVLLCAGIYEWTACVEEVKSNRRAEVGKQRPRSKTGDLDILGAIGRRVWYGEGPCVVVAEDSHED